MDVTNVFARVCVCKERWRRKNAKTHEYIYINIHIYFAAQVKNVLSALKLNFILAFSAEADGQPAVGQMCVYDVGVSHVSMLHFFKQQAETATRIAVKAVGLMRKDLHANQRAGKGTSDRHTIEYAGRGRER